MPSSSPVSSLSASSHTVSRPPEHVSYGTDFWSLFKGSLLSLTPTAFIISAGSSSCVSAIIPFPFPLQSSCLLLFSGLFHVLPCCGFRKQKLSKWLLWIILCNQASSTRDVQPCYYDAEGLSLGLTCFSTMFVLTMDSELFLN